MRPFLKSEVDKTLSLFSSFVEECSNKENIPSILKSFNGESCIIFFFSISVSMSNNIVKNIINISSVNASCVFVVVGVVFGNSIGCLGCNCNCD